LEPGLLLLDPRGRALALGGYQQVRAGLVTVKGYPLPDTGAPYETGTYQVVVTSSNGKPGSYQLVRGSSAAKVAAVQVEQPMLLGLSPTSLAAGSPLTLKVAGAEAVLGNNVVLLNDVPVAVSGGTLRRGRGSLVVTVPPATPAGATAACFRAAGEQSNRIAFTVLP
jgi:hypothetical protein